MISLNYLGDEQNTNGGEMMNSKGKTSGGLMAVLVVAILAVAIGVGFFAIPQTQTPGDEDTGAGCNTAPSLSTSFVDAINTGTTVSEDNIEVREDGVYTGTLGSDQTFAQGTEVDLLFKKSGYLNKVIAEDKELGCGTNSVNDKVYASTSPSLKFSNENNNVLADKTASTISGGDTYQSASSTLIAIDGEVQSNADESTGQMIAVVEFSNTTQVDSITSSSASDTLATPEFYSSNGANSEIQAFELSAVEDGAKRALDLSFSPESGKTIGATNETAYVNVYAAQDAVDQDGSFIENVVEDSDGNTKYENTASHDFVFSQG